MRSNQAQLLRGSERLATLEVARSHWARGRGLLGRASLDPGHGLLIQPCSSVHTWFMRFPIDVVYVDGRTDGGRDGAMHGEFEVVKVVPALRPWRFSFGGRRARHAIELAAGECARLGLQPGDRLRALPADEAAPAAPAEPPAPDPASPDSAPGRGE